MPKTQKLDLIVIGGGAGMTVAEAAVQSGLRCALVEEAKLGGTCLTRGCIPSKILVHPADVVREARDARRIGVHLPDPEVDWSVIAERMWRRIGVSADIEEGLAEIENLTLVMGRARFEGPHRVSVLTRDGETVHLEAPRIVVAAGARSFIPPVDGLEEAGCITSETFFGAAFPEQPWKDLIILGGGAIGTEFAHIFSAMGTRVTIVEMLPDLVSTEEPDVRAFLERQFRSVGIQVMTGHRAVAARRDGDRRVLIVRSEATGEQKELSCDQILVSSGIRSNADRLDVEKAGIATDARGWIQTDAQLRTSVPGIFALGDINGKYQFRHKANYEADILITNLLNGEENEVDYSVIPWAIFTYPQVAHLGMTEQQAAALHPKRWVGVHHYSSTAKGYALGFEPGDPDDGFVKLIADENRRILGVHIVGPHAAMLIQPFVYLKAADVICQGAGTRSANRDSALPDYLHPCPDPGALSPLYETLVIHPALSEVAAWVLGSLEWHDDTQS